FPECRRVDVTRTRCQAEAPPFFDILVPSCHDGRALSGECLKRRLRPTAAGGKALNTAQGLYRQLVVAGNELALFNIQILSFTDEDEVVYHAFLANPSDRQAPTGWRASGLKYPWGNPLNA